MALLTAVYLKVIIFLKIINLFLSILYLTEKVDCIFFFFKRSLDNFELFFFKMILQVKNYNQTKNAAFVNFQMLITSSP